MADPQARLAASRAEIALLRGQRVADVTPSCRDFAMFVATQRSELALVARLDDGLPLDAARLVARARACDDAEVAALSIATSPKGIHEEVMHAISEAVTAPILRENLVLHASQLLHARRHGADAALLPAGVLDGSALADLVAFGRSLHMASVIEVATAAELDVAAGLPHVIVGLRCEREDGSLDVDGTLALARRAPPQSTLLVLTNVQTVAERRALHGTCDAICVRVADDETAAQLASPSGDD
jgi:indole-3-glycerol phosphate synthase